MFLATLTLRVFMGPLLKTICASKHCLTPQNCILDMNKAREMCIK